MLLEKAIIKALQAVSPDVLFVLGGRQGVEPNYPYCLVTLVNTKTTSQPDRVMETSFIEGVETTVETIVTVKQSVFHLSFVSLAKDAFQDVAERFQIGLGSSSYIATFYEAGLGILSYNTLAPKIEVENGIDNYLCTTLSLTVSYQRIESFKTERVLEVETKGFDADSGEAFVTVDTKL